MVPRRALILLASLAVLSLLPMLSHPLSAQGTRTPGTISPLCVTGCLGNGSPVSVTIYGNSTDTVVSYGDATTYQVWFTVKNIGGYYDTYTLTMGCTNATCVSETYTSISLGPGASIGVGVTFQPGAANTTGSVSLSAADSGCSGLLAPLQGPGPSALGVEESALPSCYQSSATWTIVNVAGYAPNVSAAPHSAGLQAGADGVTYQHATPSVGSMGVQRALTLVYNSTAVRPTAVVTVDVTNAYSGRGWYPTAYQLQIQRADNGQFLTLLNGAQSVFYAASNGSTNTTRLVAALDEKSNGLATGSYAVNIVVSSIYTGGPRTVSVPSRILVNDQSSSPLGAGVGLAGVPRLYPDPVIGSYGMLLVDGSGRMSYFSRSCSSCSPFVSAAGESGTLTASVSQYRLTALDGSFVDFDGQGLVLDHYALPSIQALTFGWTSGNLTSVTDATGRGFTLNYSGGLLTGITDFANRTTATAISGGRLVAVTDADGLADSLSYDANGLLTQVKNRAGGLTHFAYNPLNQDSSVTGPTAADHTGAQVRPMTRATTAALVVWQPGIAGTSSSLPKANVRADTVMASLTDALGHVTRVAQDRFGLATKVVDPLGEITTVTRDTLGNATVVQEPNGHQTVATYTRGYLLATRNDAAAGEYVSLAYDANNRVQTASGGALRRDYIYHDGTQGPSGTLKIALAGGSGTWPSTGADTVAHHYPDAYGRDTLVTDGLGHPTRWAYATPANGGNLLQQIDANHDTTSYQYWPTGLVSVTALPGLATHQTHYDALSRPDVGTDALGIATTYTYSPLGLTRVAAAGGTYKFDLNAWGLLVARHDLADSTKADSLWYDAGGNIRSVKTRRGDTIAMTYDALGRLLTRSGPDFPQQTFAYGPNGAWTVAANANGRDSTTFDQMGRPTSTTQVMSNGTTAYQMSYTYDAHGRLTSRAAPSGGSTLRLVYNASFSTLDTLCALGVCAAFGRDAELKPVRITYRAPSAGGWTHYLVYDSLHLVARDTFDTGTQLNPDFATTWNHDRRGRLTSAVTSLAGNMWPTYFQYDANGQLTNACQYAGGQYCYSEYTVSPAYAYDAAGNRTEQWAEPTLGLGNRMLTFKNYRLAYDRNGADTLKAGLNYGPWYSTDTTRLAWNALGQLVRAEHWNAGGAHTVDSLFYDALGRRVAKQVNGMTTWYVYDGDQIVLDVMASTGAMVAEYAYLGSSDLFGMRTPTDTLVALRTATNGTIVGMARARDGVEVKRYPVLNTPWSQQTPDTGLVVRFRMGGQEYDQETGLYHLGVRYYDPQIGRFLSEDPAGIAGGLNLYAYAGNDPIGRRDPTGKDFVFMYNGQKCRGWLTFDGFGEMHAGTDDFGNDVIFQDRLWTFNYVCSSHGKGSGGDPAGGSGTARVPYRASQPVRQRQEATNGCWAEMLSFAGQAGAEALVWLGGGKELKEGFDLIRIGVPELSRGSLALLQSATARGIVNEGVLARLTSAANVLFAGGANTVATGVRLLASDRLVPGSPQDVQQSAGAAATSGFSPHDLIPFNALSSRYSEYTSCVRAY